MSKMANLEKQDNSVFLISNEQIQLSSGTFVVVPKVNLRVILATSNTLGNLLKEIKEQFPELISGAITADGKINPNIGDYIISQLPQIIAVVLPQVLKHVVSLCSQYTNVCEDVILDEWNMEDMVKILSPFFVNILSQMNVLIEKMTK